MSIKNLQTHYIIGIGRSGTSLLMSLLGAHPSIHGTPENYFSVFFAKKFKNKTRFSAHDIRLIHRFNIAFNKLQPYVAFQYTLNEENDLLKNGFKGNYNELCQQIYLSFEHATIKNTEAKIIIDKNPSNTLFTNKILDFNPNSKFILVVRDYRANILSRKESIHLLSPNVAFNSIRWNYFTKKALQLKEKFPEKVLLIRYEDLVRATDETLNTIFVFLDVECINSQELRERERASYLEFEHDEKLKSSVRIQKKYGDLAKPIFTNRTEKWKENLTAFEIETTEAICNEVGKKVGYFPIKNISSIRNFYLRLKNLILFMKIHITFQKDYFFYHLPIEYKVKKFENFVQKINEKRELAKK